jgi:hypothetical protein
MTSSCCYVHNIFFLQVRNTFEQHSVCHGLDPQLTLRVATAAECGAYFAHRQRVFVAEASIKKFRALLSNIGCSAPACNTRNLDA